MNSKCGWQIFIVLIVIKFVVADKNNEEYLDPVNTESNTHNWQNLFIQINKILSETTKLNENMGKLNARQNNLENQMLDLKKGLEEHKLVVIQTFQSVQENFNILDRGHTELKTAMVQFSQNMEQHSENLKKVQNEQNATLNELKGNEHRHFKELEKKQDEHTNATNQFMANVQKHFKNLEQGQSENLRNFTCLINPWITILRRQDGSVNFNRNWTEYKNGFGNANGEFFIGLDKLHAMTNEADRKELHIVLKDFEDNVRYAEYDHFRIGNETENYIIKNVGNYSGNAGDSLKYHQGEKFSTYDHDNDNWPSRNCAEEYKGGWWFHTCYHCNLGGIYRTKSERQEHGIIWLEWKTHSLKYAEMKIRNKNSCVPNATS